MTPFIVYSLPRSRSAWLSHFLSYGEWKCHHDIVTDFHSIPSLQDFFSQPYIGTCETAMIDGWSLVEKLVPDAKIVIIRRPLEDIYRSLNKFNISANLTNRMINLENASKNLEALVIDYVDLDKEEACKKIFEYCLEVDFDREWWISLKDVNIQVDMEMRLSKIAQNREGIEKLKIEAAKMMEVA